MFYLPSCYLINLVILCSQVVYNDNSSLVYQYPGYGFNPYPSIMLEGQIPVSPAYYPPYGAPSAMHYIPSDIDPTSAYMIPFGQYGGANYSGNQGDTSLTSHIPYPQTMGILGPYDHTASQVQTLSICLLCFNFYGMIYRTFVWVR